MVGARLSLFMGITPVLMAFVIGAGIGITPFIARMKHLAREGRGPRDIDLYHPTAVEDPKALDKLRADAQAAGIRLHVLVSERDGRLSGPMLVEQLIKGLVDAGCHVSDVGLVPTPALYYAADRKSVV